MEERVRDSLANGFIAVMMCPFILFTGMVLGAADCCRAAQPQEGGIQFLWGCVAMTARGSEPRREKIIQKTVLQTGDQIKMSLKFKKKAFVYVIYRSARGELELLFPYRFFGPDSEILPDRWYYIPRGDAWLVMGDTPGEEQVHLIASKKPLSRLEELLGQYEDSDAEKKTTVASEVMKEIQDLQHKNRKLSASAERPVTMAGRVRGVKELPALDYPDVAGVADEIVASDFFSRTITIEHQ